MREQLVHFAIQALETLSPVFLALLSLAALRLASYIQAHVKNAKVQGILLRLDDAAVTAVGALEQTMVTAAKKSSEDGKLSPQIVTEVKAAALTEIKSQLGAKGVSELGKVLGISDIDKYLSTRIEAQVQKL